MFDHNSYRNYLTQHWVILVHIYVCNTDITFEMGISIVLGLFYICYDGHTRPIRIHTAYRVSKNVKPNWLGKLS